MSRDEHAALLISATRGFDFLFANDIDGARNHFTGKDDPFHQLGLGVCAFLQAALGMEPAMLAEANRALSLAEAGSRKQLKSQKNALEWEILSADTVVLLGLTNALSETYMGYLQCMYSLNSAHSKFAKLYKTVFPNGLEGYKTPAASPSPSRHSSSYSVHSTASTPTPSTKTGFFSRFTSSGSNLAVPSKNAPTTIQQDGPIDELIVSGTAFGYGLFNLVLSLLPKGIQNVVGFFGFKHDRRLALQALAVSATKGDVHAVFSGLVLMTYHGVILLLSGYQADEAHIIKQYRAIVDKLEAKYPQGALWILNRAKILRMSNKPNDAIQVLQDGLKSTQGHSFAQADTLLVFELAWTLLGQRRYQEAADMFLRLTELNSWSHATYHFLAAGCYISLGNIAKAQELFNAIPDLISKRKINGKEPPTEVMIKKKLEFYKEKQRRRGGVEAYYAQAVKISPAEELGIFWNTHSRIDKFLAEAHIEEWASLTPLAVSTVPGINPDSLVGRLTKVTLSPKAGNEESESLDLDTPDEMAIRSLLLGIAYRTIGEFDTSRKYLRDACNRQALVKISTWIGGVSMFELAVLDLKQVEAKERAQASDGSVGISHLSTAAKLVAEWESALQSSSEKLDAALALTANSTDLSSRLDSRISMLRDEIALKREMLGIS